MYLSIDCRFFGKSGIGTFISNVVDSMLNSHQNNDYLLIVEKYIEKYNDIPNVKQFECSIKPFSIKELIFFPVKEINKTDAFFSPYINIPCGIKVPVFGTIHDVLFWDMPGLVSKIGLYMRTFFVKHTIWASYKVFTVSNFSKKRILHHFGITKDIVVVPNGVSDLIKNYNQQRIREDYILYVGNVKPHKGLHILVNAYLKARSNGLTSSLKIVGEKDSFRSVDIELLNSISKCDGIEFTGKLSDLDLYKTISSAKVLVLPSLYEGFGIPPMEAMYLGTPVILSDIEVLKEIYDGFPVVFFKSGDMDELANIFINNAFVEFSTDVKNQIDSKYSYSITSEIILSQISTSLCIK